MASGEAMERLPSLRLGSAVRREVGTSDVVYRDSNTRAGVFACFSSRFTTVRGERLKPGPADALKPGATDDCEA